MEDLLARSEAQRRFVMIVLEAFALLALTLAVIGLYGVLAGSVTERKREIGVRAALGASRESILTLVVRRENHDRCRFRGRPGGGASRE
jgi:putative ABC transport system permease protein